ncbi:MAG: SUMF1/EgtB/PvdO family nonheme iron enzyme [Desulfobacterales bacterium]|nr:SUMF1/EgtB/PvdO family nonheme iron enzyme [Desulfobacterales bacterium]
MSKNINVEKSQSVYFDLVYECGNVKVKSRPSAAKWYLNNEEVGTTSGEKTALKEGQYDVKVVKDGYIDWTGKVTVKAGGVESIEAVLKEVDKIKGEWKEPITGIEFVLIPAGAFNMGSPDTEKVRYDNEGPVHKVTLDAFYMAKYEVTNSQYVKFLNDVGKRGPSGQQWFETEQEDSTSKISGTAGNFNVKAGYEKYPVVNVSYYGAEAFVKWLAGKTGKNISLPTEAEWEYACRASSSTPFYFGNCLSTNQANYDGNYPYEGCDKGKYIQAPVKVGSYAKNDFGLYDMHGNVWEWCLDFYDSNYYKNSPEKNPMGPSSGSSRVLRGGSWFNFA